MQLRSFTVLVFAVLFALFLALAANANDQFEIQVYDGSINEPGVFSMELHTNHTAGRNTPDYDQEIPPHGMTRFTLEPAYGMSKVWEIGAYLQAAVTPDGMSRYAGTKLRSKIVFAHEESDKMRLGLNFEVSRMSTAFEEDPWGAEIRPIFSYDWGTWMVAFNPNIEVGAPNDDAVHFDFGPGLKLGYHTPLGWMFGLEHYSDFGQFKNMLPPAQQTQNLFVAADLDKGPMEVNIGVGKGITSANNDWYFKVILGKDIWK